MLKKEKQRKGLILRNKSVMNYFVSKLVDNIIEKKTFKNILPFLIRFLKKNEFNRIKKLILAFWTSKNLVKHIRSAKSRAVKAINFI